MHLSMANGRQMRLRGEGASHKKFIVHRTIFLDEFVCRGHFPCRMLASFVGWKHPGGTCPPHGQSLAPFSEMFHG
jgi:hypothetical protein